LALIITFIIGSFTPVYIIDQNPRSSENVLNEITIMEPSINRRGTRANQEFWTYVYSMDQIKLFSYIDGTTITLYDDTGSISWYGTLDKGEVGGPKNLLPGVYEARGSEKFSTLTMARDDPLVAGYYAKNEEGAGLSTELYTYVPSLWYGYEKFIIFSYEDGTSVDLSYLDGTPMHIYM
jgi:hypothetical protein